MSKLTGETGQRFSKVVLFSPRELFAVAFRKRCIQHPKIKPKLASITLQNCFSSTFSLQDYELIFFITQEIGRLSTLRIHSSRDHCISISSFVRLSYSLVLLLDDAFYPELTIKRLNSLTCVYLILPPQLSRKRKNENGPFFQHTTQHQPASLKSP